MVPLIPLREPCGIFALVVVIVGVLNVHTVLRNTRCRTLEAPVEVLVTGEKGHEVIGPEVAAVVAIQVMAVVVESN